MYFDTHVHLDDEKYNNDREEVIEHIRKEGVSCVVNIGADIESSKKSAELASKYDFIYASVGVHPYDVGNLTEDDMLILRKLSANKKVVAIGEIGLDYSTDEPSKDVQKKWFARQIELAKELNLPYIVHDRDAHLDTYEILKASGYTNGVLHCFSGSAEFAKQILDLGFYIAFGGTVTFKNAKKVKEAAKVIPPERLLLETDCPYLAPEPNRGKRNDPSQVKHVAAYLAELRGENEDELIKMCTENGKRIFGIN